MNNANDAQVSSAQKKEQVRRTQSVVPLVACQINKCEDEEFKLFGMQSPIANLVGILRNFEVQSTKATCNIEDHTGSIKAIMWLETDNDSVVTIPPVKEGHYVKVFGSVRNQDGEKILMILKMFPIDDCNVITNHLLQAIHARLAIEKLMQGQVSVKQPIASTSSMSDMGATAASATGLSKIQDQIFRILQPVKDNVGVSRDAIMKNFAPSQLREVNDALEFLLNEGHAYTTINNDHFKATDF
ncbi:replication protein A2, partial [Asbolus verrucosus]